jgi:hypothetical protein
MFFRAHLLGACLLTLTMAAVPASIEAQEASLSGTVTDVSGGVLPGVTITAVHELSGNTFVAVSDERGQFRLPLRIGRYRITAELTGFASVTRSLELLVGQQASTNWQMSPAALQETVTVSGEAPLIDTTQSKLGGNIDARQMQEMPLAGRNWLDLTLLAPGAQANAQAGAPVSRELDGRRMMYQLNMDGQAANQNLSFGQYNGKMSRDALAEFEVITNRFDATQGRAAGMQVNAVTRSGTNQFMGTLSGYFRDDKFMAADPVAERVLPYANQQLSGTFGGPLRRDKAHFFAYYEREREPQTLLFNSAYPAFNLVLPTFTRAEYKWGTRFDMQLTPSRRLMVRGNRWNNYQPMERGGATQHPSIMTRTEHWSNQVWGTFTQVLGSSGVAEVAGGYTAFARPSAQVIQERLGDDCRGIPEPTTLGVMNPCVPPDIRLRGYRIGHFGTYPQDTRQRNYQVKGTLNYVISAGKGVHEVKVGGEYIDLFVNLDFDQNYYGTIDATGGPVPANIESLFPVWDDPRTWNLAALSPITVSYSQSLGGGPILHPRDVYAAWFQDNWSLIDSLTLNLGVRYDVSKGGVGEHVPPLPPIRPDQDIKSDLNNVAPRLGLVYTLPDRATVIRGGWGRFFVEQIDSNFHTSHAGVRNLTAQVFNDGRPDFASNPFNGNPPTREELLTGVRNFTFAVIDPKANETPYADTTSIGFQRQVGQTMSVQADYVWRAHRQDPYSENGNLTYDPATGLNYSFDDVSRRRYPEFGLLPISRTGAEENYHGLETAFTKRFSNGWQAAATYTLSGMTNWRPCWGDQSTCPEDLGGVWVRSVGEQRHRAVFNGIWEMPYDFQLSGLYFYGSGARNATTTGSGDVRQQGANFSGLVRRDGTIMPANDLVGQPLHRVDMRIQRRFRVGGRATAYAMVEMFNLFNHANYGSYVTVESSPVYRRPTQTTAAGGQNVAYVPRMAQFGFRVAF